MDSYNLLKYFLIKPTLRTYFYGHKKTIRLCYCISNDQNYAEKKLLGVYVCPLSLQLIFYNLGNNFVCQRCALAFAPISSYVHHVQCVTLN